MKPFYKYLLAFSIPIAVIFIYMDYRESHEIHIVKHLIVAIIAGTLFAYTVAGMLKRKAEKKAKE